MAITQEQMQAAMDRVMDSLQRNSAQLGATIEQLIAEGAAEVAAATPDPLEWIRQGRPGDYHYTAGDGEWRIGRHGAHGFSISRKLTAEQIVKRYGYLMGEPFNLSIEQAIERVGPQALIGSRLYRTLAEAKSAVEAAR